MSLIQPVSHIQVIPNPNAVCYRYIGPQRVVLVMLEAVATGLQRNAKSNIMDLLNILSQVLSWCKLTKLHGNKPNKSPLPMPAKNSIHSLLAEEIISLLKWVLVDGICPACFWTILSSSCTMTGAQRPQGTEFFIIININRNFSRSEDVLLDKIKESWIFVWGLSHLFKS